MKTFQLTQGDLYISDDCLKELFKVDKESGYQHYKSAEDVLRDRLDLILEERPKFQEYLDLYKKQSGLDKFALLEAHGDSGAKWLYFDKRKRHSIQKWVNSIDGKYAAILFHVCNPQSEVISSKKSILVVPDNTVGDWTNASDSRCAIGENANYDIFHPTIGKISSYTVDYELSKLEKLLAVLGWKNILKSY